MAALCLGFTLVAPLVGAGPLPQDQGENSCLDCHLTLEGRAREVAEEWQRSIHARSDVDCVSCHGGDASARERDVAEAGFLGAIPRRTVPDLCGGCHADGERMQPYGLPTDQPRQYREESVHGQRLAQGDENVAICYDCHGGHEIRESNDPTSSVYPGNLPGTCAQCHADEELMRPYGIPTDQYALYKESVHGLALLQERNLRAPTCATCHGNHGAALPGYTEVPDLCGLQCHPLAEETYLAGPHGRGGEGAPNCVRCHGRYDVRPASEEMFLGAGARSCGSCHLPGTPEREVVDRIYQELASAAESLVEARAALTKVRLTRTNLAAEETTLLEAHTALSVARVLQHALRVEPIVEKTDEAKAISAQVRDDIQKVTSVGQQEMRALFVMVLAPIAGFPALLLAKGVWDRLRKSP
ncbi:MAG: cytochrome c3 family protein [Anaerolineae bacterium]